MGCGVGVAAGVGVATGVGVALAPQPVEGTAVQLPTAYSVPPRVMSRLPLAWLVKVVPRRPANTEPAEMAPFDANWLSLLTATLMVTVPFVVLKAPQSASPRGV